MADGLVRPCELLWGMQESEGYFFDYYEPPVGCRVRFAADASAGRIQLWRQWHNNLKVHHP
jgi:hypothetical protein